MQRSFKNTLWSAGSLAVVLASIAPLAAQDRDPMVLYEQNGAMVRAHLQAGLNLVGEQALFWNLADIFAQSSNYNPDKVWLEGYVKPGLSFRSELSDSETLYGMVSAIG